VSELTLESLARRLDVEEQMRGWLAAIAKERTILRQITAYRELTDLLISSPD
jgi:hypothetical protein